LKSKVGCFLPKSPQVVLGSSRRLEVDLGSLVYQVGSDWNTKVTPRSNHTVLNIVWYCNRNAVIMDVPVSRLMANLDKNVLLFFLL